MKLTLLSNDEMADIRAIYDCKPYGTYNFARAVENAVIAKCKDQLEAELAKKERMIELVIDGAEIVNKEFAAERDALKAENLGCAKSLLDLEAEVERLTKQYEALSQAYGLMCGSRK